MRPDSRAGVTVSNNSIVNPQSLGINVNAGDWGGSALTGNLISRGAGAYAGDDTQAFTGIGITPPSSPVTVTSIWSVKRPARHWPASALSVFG